MPTEAIWCSGVRGQQARFPIGTPARSCCTNTTRHQYTLPYANHVVATHERNPTPKPLMIRPNTIIVKPLVKVWMAPPTEKMKAPRKSVLLRPSRSPSFPDNSDVTVRSA